MSRNTALHTSYISGYAQRVVTTTVNLVRASSTSAYTSICTRIQLRTPVTAVEVGRGTLLRNRQNRDTVAPPTHHRVMQNIEGAYFHSDEFLCMPDSPPAIMKWCLQEFSFNLDDILIVSYPQQGHRVIIEPL